MREIRTVSTRSAQQALLDVWGKFSLMRPRPALYVGETRPRSVDLYIEATYETLELAYGSELLHTLGRFRTWATAALERRCGTSLGSHSAASYLEHHDPDLDQAVDTLFDLHEKYIAEILGLEVETVWLPRLEPDPTMADPRLSSRIFIDSCGSQLWGRLYTQPLNPELPLHAAILERSARLRARLGEFPLPLPPIHPLSWPTPEPLRFSCFFEQDIENIRALGDPIRLAAAAFQTQSRLSLLQEARQGSDAEIVLAALACQRVARIEPRLDLVELWGLLDLLGHRNPANGAPHVLRGRVYLHIGLLEEAWRSFRRAARLSAWETWDAHIRQLNVTTAEAIGWPPLEARSLALGTGPFCNAALMLMVDLKKLPLLPPSVLRALHNLALRQHRGGLAVERMVAAGLERWTRSLLPALARTPDEGAAYLARAGPALEWLQQLDAHQISPQRWIAYHDQVYGESELAAIRALQAGHEHFRDRLRIRESLP